VLGDVRIAGSVASKGKLIIAILEISIVKCTL